MDAQGHTAEPSTFPWEVVSVAVMAVVLLATSWIAYIRAG